MTSMRSVTRRSAALAALAAALAIGAVTPSGAATGVAPYQDTRTATVTQSGGCVITLIGCVGTTSADATGDKTNGKVSASAEATENFPVGLIIGNTCDIGLPCLVYTAPGGQQEQGTRLGISWSKGEGQIGTTIPVSAQGTVSVKMEKITGGVSQTLSTGAGAGLAGRVGYITLEAQYLYYPCDVDEICAATHLSGHSIVLASLDGPTTPPATATLAFPEQTPGAGKVYVFAGIGAYAYVSGTPLPSTSDPLPFATVSAFGNGTISRIVTP